MTQTNSTREANWTICYRDEKTANNYFIFDLVSDDNFTCTSKREEAIRMCWSAAKVMAEVLKKNTGYNIFITLI